MRRWPAVGGLLALVALAGCGLAPTGEVGTENGYAWDADLAVTTADGLNESELRAVKSRAMARVERLRGLEFTADVPVRVVSRAAYRANRSGGNRTADPWNEQVWEGLFLVGEDREVGAVFDELYGGAVQGYYSPSRDEIVVVSDADPPRVSRDTLVHELVHALQDQQFGFEAAPDTQDAQLAQQSVVEGEATLLTERYRERCGAAWDCVPTVDGGGGGGLSNPGVFLAVYQPYAAGPDFVAAVQRRGGWSAVDRLHEAYPASTEQVLHPERYPGEAPVTVTVPDRSTAAWSRFDHDPVGDTVGEASVYAMLVANGVGDPASRYGYDLPAAAGWAGDSLVPYRSGERYGYVWTTVWDDPGEAREFAAAYRNLLAEHDAVARGGGVYVVPEGSFADAFRVTVEGSRVTVTNAPTVAALDGVHAPA